MNYDIIVNKEILKKLIEEETDLNNIFGKLSILEGGNYKEAISFFTKYGYI